jgi:acyl carrier protein
MTREDIEEKILRILRDSFEIEQPNLDDDLRECYGFDSIDAIELIVAIERLLQRDLAQEVKKQAMDIRTVRQICDYVERLARETDAPQG